MLGYCTELWKGNLSSLSLLFLYFLIMFFYEKKWLSANIFDNASWLSLIKKIAERELENLKYSIANFIDVSPQMT